MWHRAGARPGGRALGPADLRELLLGPKRFTDLERDFPTSVPTSSPSGCASSSGSERYGDASSRRRPGPVYELTEWGLQLEPVVLALGRWGSRRRCRRSPRRSGVDAVVVALKTMFDPAVSGGLPAVSLRLGEHGFAITVADGEIELHRGEVASPAASIDTDPGTLAAVLALGTSIRSPERSTPECCGSMVRGEQWRSSWSCSRRRPRLRDSPRERAPPAPRQQHRPLALVPGQRDRVLEFGARLGTATELDEEVGPHAGEQVVVGEPGIAGQGVDQVQSLGGAVGHRDRDGAVELHHRPRRQLARAS